MKRMLALLICLSALMVLGTACGSGAGPESPPSGVSSSSDTEKTSFRIGISQPNHVLFRVASAQEIELWEARIEAETNIQIEILMTDGSGDPAKQVADVLGLLEEKVDILLVCPYRAGTLAEVLPEFERAGIPVILFERENEQMDFVRSFIVNDDEAMGKAIGEFAAEQLGGVGRIAIIEGTQGISSVVKRQRGFMRVMEDYPEIVIAADVVGENSRDVAAQRTFELYAEGEVYDLIFSHTDDMLLGVMDALGELNPERLPILVGIDGRKEVLRLVMEGVVAGTVARTNEFPAAVETAWKVLHGELVEKRILLPMTLITTPEQAEAHYSPYSVF